MTMHLSCLILVTKINSRTGSGGNELNYPTCGALVGVLLLGHVGFTNGHLSGRKQINEDIETSAAQCNVALVVNLNPNGGFSEDTGRWHNIAQRGKFVVDSCLSDQMIGGGIAKAGRLITYHYQARDT